MDRHRSHPACGRCGARAAAGVRRCTRCGCRLFSDEPESAKSEPAGQPVPRLTARPGVGRRNSLERISGITELEREILRAAVDGRREGLGISIYGRSGDVDGEIKAGARRIYGNEAVAAVAGLVARGLVVATADDRFELTDFGTRMAPALTWSRPASLGPAGLPPPRVADDSLRSPPDARQVEARE